MCTVVFFRGKRHIYDGDADAARAIREYLGPTSVIETDAEVIRAAIVAAVRAAKEGLLAEVAVTHLP